MDNTTKEKAAKNDEPIAGFKKLYDIIVQLRSKNGCAWDREQTSRSLLPNLVEESYELFEAVEDNDDHHIMEELGDLFLLITMISYIKQENSDFTLNDIFSAISEKLIRRHPHVFGKVNMDDPDHIVKQWNQIKRDVEGRDNSDYITDSIPNTLPPLEKSYKIQKKAAEYGFDWINIQDVIKKLEEEISELKQELDMPEESLNKTNIERELGDILFAAVNISRFLNIDPCLALHSTNKKFIRRFSYVQDRLKENKMELSREQMEAMELYWNESKEYYP